MGLVIEKSIEEGRSLCECHSRPRKVYQNCKNGAVSNQLTDDGREGCETVSWGEDNLLRG
jgi:hypothetical protein